MNEVIHSAKAPVPLGPYSQAIKSGSVLFLSGQIPINPLKGEMVEGSFADAVRQVMANLKAVLAESGMETRDIVKVTVYFKKLKNFDEFNTIYAEYFNENPPARSVMEVSGLPKGAALMMDAIAVGE